MKIEAKSKSFSHLPLVTQELILRIVDKSVEEIVAEIEKVDFWHYGKYELGYWIDVLDTFDYILSTVTSGHDATQQECGIFMCPKLTNPVVKSQILAVLNFTSLLIQHSYSGHNIYNSTEHLCILLASADLDIVLAVLNLLYVLGKDFMSNLPTQLMNNLCSYLEFLGESWGGGKKGFGLVQCCQDISMDGFPPITSSVYFEYHPHSEESVVSTSSHPVKSIQVHNVYNLSETLPELMSRLTQGHSLSSMEMMHLMTRLRYSKNFADPHHRRKCVLIRLLAISVLLCSMSSDKVLVYDGLIEELVEVLKMKDLIQIQGSSQRRGLKRKISNDFCNSETKSIKKCQMNVVSSAQGAALRHEVPKVENTNSDQLEGGVFNEDNVIQESETTTTLEQEIRIAVLRSLTAIVNLKKDDMLSTIVEVTGASMYHGFLPALIRDCVIAITDEVPNGIAGGYLLEFVTAMFSFVYHLETCVAGGNPLVNSGVMESLLLVIQSRAIQPMNISLVTSAVRIVDAITNQDPTTFHRFKGWEKIIARLKMEVDVCRDDVPDVLSCSVTALGQFDTDPVPMETSTTPPSKLSFTSDNAIHCMAERSMLIECILELLSKVMPEFEENIRNFVNSSLPSSLEHIISNAEYYALKVFSMVICHDPSQLSSLQESGLPWVIMNSLIRKKIPVAPEVLDALPDVLNAICINSCGLRTFIDCDPFDHLFKVLVTPEYLLMKRQNNEAHTRTLGKTLGSAMYELLKKRPLLIPSAIGSLIKLLRLLGNDVSTDGIKGSQDEGSYIQSENLQSEAADTLGDSTRTGDSGVENKTTTPSLYEYIQNVVDFIDSFMSHRPLVLNEFISRRGLQPLISLLVLPELPSSHASSSSCTFAILALHQCTAHEGAVMDEGFSQFSHVLSELITFARITPDKPPLPRTVAAADGYIKLFIELANHPPGTSQQISIKKWASPQGQKVFDQLVLLHRALMWEECLYVANQEQTTPSIMNLLMSSKAEVNKDEIKDHQRKSVQGSASSNPLMSGIKQSLAVLLKLLVDVCSQQLKRCSIVKFDDPLLEECITVGLKMADLLNDCLTWDQSTFGVVSNNSNSGPCYSKDILERARIVHESFAVKTCKTLVFDEREKSFHLMLHCFNERRVLDKLISSLQFVLTCCIRNVQFEGNHSAVTSDFFGVWFELCKMLIDTTCILDSTHILFIPSPSEEEDKKLSHNPLFDPLMFIAETQKAIVSCVIDLWPPVNIGAPVLPILMKTIIQCYKCETVIKENLNKLNNSCDLSFVKDASGPTQILADQLLECVLGQVSYVCDMFSTSCDLLVTLMKRGDSVWRYKALMAVKLKALQSMMCLCDRISDGSYDIKDGVLGPNSRYIWLLTTLLIEVPLTSGPILCQADLLQSCCKLLVLTQQKVLSGEERFINPMWLVPLLLMLEVWISIKYTAMLSRPVPEGHVAVWLWFNNAKNEWCYHPDGVSGQIETAYQNNKDTCKISIDKRKHEIQFSSMAELNENEITAAILRLEVPENVKHNATESLDDNTNSIIKKEVPLWYCPLSEEQAILIVTHCTRLLSVHALDPTTLHANMRLLVSLTRDPHLACVFMSERGPHALLSLTRRSCFNGFSSLSSLLFRHVLEDSNLLGYCMDSVIHEVIVGNPYDDPEEVKVHNSRDFDYVLRRLSPCVCRDQELFMRIAGERMRLLDEPIPLTDYSNTTQLHPVRLQYEPQQNIEPFVLTSVQTNLLSMLIDHFYNPGFTEDVLSGDQFQESQVDQDRQDKIENDDKTASDDSGNDFNNETRSNMVLELEPVSNTCQTGLTGVALEESGSNQELSSVKDVEKKKATSSESMDSEPMLTQTCTLRLLAEIIVSYPVFAKTILESSREMKVRNSNNNDTKVVMSVLTLTLDYLLPALYIQGSSAIQVAMFARIFLLTLASTTLPDDALMLFINEIKALFARALSLPESLIKHQRIQAIASLLGEIIEPQVHYSSRSIINPTQFVLTLIRRGFITDLSKVVHSMDLSSCFLSTTINTILKPLESLTKIITQFLNAQKKGQVTGPGSNTTIATKDFSYTSTDDLEVELIKVIHSDDEGDDGGDNLSCDYFEEPTLCNPKDIDEIHNYHYHGKRSNIIQQFLLNNVDGSNSGHSNIDSSEPLFSISFESTTIPTNISRWREESIALDGVTAFLRVADLRSPLLAILVDELLSIHQVVRKQRLNEAIRTMPTPQPCFQDYIQRVLANSTSTSDVIRIIQEGRRRKVDEQKRYESQVLNTRFIGQPIVDHEGLTCLLAMLFLGQSCANFSGLFKVIRSLSQHVPSCTWLITSLLSILKKITHTCPIPSEMLSCTIGSESHWLNMTVPNLVHGSCVPVFSFPSLSQPVSLSDVTIHPYASESIYDITLDLMIFLAKQFPSAFLPPELHVAPKHNQLLCDPSTCFPSDFWQILFYLESSSHGGKDVVKGLPHPDPPSAEEQALSDVFSHSPIGVLMRCLDSPIVQGNVNRIKMVLRVLVVISGAIPKHDLGTEDSKEAVGATSKDGSYSRGLETSSDTSSKGLDMHKTPSGPVHTVPLCYSSSAVSVDLLNSVIDLLTSGECNEDLLENATNLLINLSQCSADTRETIFLLLLNGVRRIGCTLSEQISVLLMELRNKMSSLSASSSSSSSEEYTTNNTVPSLRLMEGVVISAVQGSGQDTTPTQQNLHLSCTKPLVCKDSQQSFFLRLIKTVFQLSCSNQVTHTNYVTPSNKPESAANEPHTVPLSIQLDFEELWTTLSDCLDALSDTYDPHAALVLQPTLESFFLVHADHNQGVRSTHTRYVSSHTRPCTTRDSESSVESSTIFNTSIPFFKEDMSSASSATLSPNMARFLQFAERHHTVLNQILRQTTTPLSKGCFAVVVNHTHLLDFDIKRRYFRYELDQLDKDVKRKPISIRIRRDHIFKDSYDALSNKSSDELIKGNLRIIFKGEEGVDAGGLLREWYLIIAREMFNPDNALFKTPGDRATYTPNPASYVNRDHLEYFKFIGRVIAKAIYDNKLLDCYFTRSFYKHILGKPVHYTDMESEDNAFYRSMVFLLDHGVDEFGTELAFSTEINEFGETIVKDLKPNGRDIPVTESNKKEYVQLVCQMKMTGSIHKQITSFLEGFYEIIPKSLISIFNEQELELLISGLPHFDLNDLKANTEYRNYTETSLQIQWFWRALRSYSQADRTRFLQFVTGTSKVPLQGFVALEGMNGIQKFRIYRDDRSTDRLPTAHTCFNHLDLPPYETYDKLYRMLLTAIRECPEGYGFA